MQMLHRGATPYLKLLRKFSPNGMTMTDRLTGWETTRLSKHFILLDFMADHSVYRSGTPLAFNDNEVWNEEHGALAKGLCNDLLERLMMDERFGPISIADAFWPSVFKRGHADPKRYGPKHRWTEGEATVDIALYRLVDSGKTGRALKEAVESVTAIGDFRDRVISYLETEFVCLTFKEKGAKICGNPNTDKGKTQKLRAHHVRVGPTSTCSLLVMAGRRKRHRSGAQRRRTTTDATTAR